MPIKNIKKELSPEEDMQQKINSYDAKLKMWNDKKTFFESEMARYTESKPENWAEVTNGLAKKIYHADKNIEKLNEMKDKLSDS